MLLIGRTLIFLFAIVRCLFAVSTRIFLFLSHGMAKEAPSDVLKLPQCMDKVIQYHSLSIAAELESYSYTKGLKVCHENKKISKNAGRGKNVWKNMRNFTRTSTWSRRVIRCLWKWRFSHELSNIIIYKNKLLLWFLVRICCQWFCWQWPLLLQRKLSPFIVLYSATWICWIMCAANRPHVVSLFCPM